jgi:hypothetical protein
LNPAEFARWLEERRTALRERWLSEILSRTEVEVADDLDALLRNFLDLVVRLIPGALGPYRTQVEPLWREACELFGNVATSRGLSAGEVIEEFQLLREGVIKLLYTEGGGTGEDGISLRDLLRLNRVVDRGVTFAAVGYTDALFFALFQGSGVRSELNGEFIVEVEEQIRMIGEEYSEVMGHLAGDGAQNGGGEE